MGKIFDDKFIAYHYRNPHIFELFVKLSRQLKDAGHKHYSARAVFHRIRWHFDVEVDARERFKVNNNYTSRYVRLLEEVFPEFKGFYRKRQIRGEGS